MATQGLVQAIHAEGEDRLRRALAVVQRIVDVRDRAARPVGRADRMSATGLGIGYLIIALVGASVAPLPTLREAGLLGLLVGLYVLAHRTEFVAPGGSTVPTEPVLVGLLLTTPLPLVPLAVLVALQLGGAGQQETGSRANDLLARLISGWHCLGPVAVLWAFPPGRPRLAEWPVYVLALLAQFVVDAGSAALRSWALGVPPRRLVAPLRWTFTVDALLAPLGLCVVVASGGSPAGLALLVVPIALVRLLARDRNEQLATAVTLGTAFTAVQEQARVDVLTGLANRRVWSEAVAEAQARLDAEPQLGVTALITDVDGLKRVNDSHGHDAGDEVLRAVAGVLTRVAPEGAVVARLGGDEFGVLVVAPCADSPASRLLADARAALERHPEMAGGPLSASLGVAACPPAQGVRHAVHLADLAAADDKLHRRAGRA
jgi:diguanylate cyclase (GGDEF)-like protein